MVVGLKQTQEQYKIRPRFIFLHQHLSPNEVRASLNVSELACVTLSHGLYSYESGFSLIIVTSQWHWLGENRPLSPPSNEIRVPKPD